MIRIVCAVFVCLGLSSAEGFVLPSAALTKVTSISNIASTVPFSVRPGYLIALENKAKPKTVMSSAAHVQVIINNLVGISDAIKTNLARHTRWIVAGSSAIGVLWRQDAAAYSMLVGAVSNGILSKFLKHVLKQERPDGAPVSDPGMPSSHAMTLFFLTSYLCAATTVWTPWQPVCKVITSLGLSFFAVNSVIWRVAARYHTRDQVLVGSILGALHGFGWFALTAAHPAALARLDGVVRRRPLIAVGVGVAAVCWPSFLRWVEDSYIAFAARRRSPGGPKET